VALVIALAAVLGAVAAVAIPRVTGRTEGSEQADRLRTAVAPYTDPALSGAVVATVNGGDITQSRLDGTVNATGSDLSSKDALDQLIEYELLDDEGVRLGLVPSDAEVQANLAITREHTPKEAVQVAIDLAAEAGVVITEDEYWSHPTVVDAARKALTVREAREALADTAGPDATPAERDAALEQELARLWAEGDVVIIEPSLQ